MKDAKNKGRLKEWIKTKGKNIVGKGLDIFGEFTGKEAIEKIGEALQDSPELSEEEKAEAAELVRIELKEFELANQDRDSARKREVELAKTGSNDFLMYATGLTALSSFILMICAVIFIEKVQDNPLAVHLLGMIEGIAGSIFFYYFGSSKGSKDKNEILIKNQNK